MFIDSILNYNFFPAVLLNESYRDNGKVKGRTLANFSYLDSETIGLIKRRFKGEFVVSARKVF